MTRHYRDFKKHLFKIRFLLKNYKVEYPDDFIVKIEKGKHSNYLKLERGLRTAPFLILNSSKYIILYYVGSNDLSIIKKYLGINSNIIKKLEDLRDKVNNNIYILLEHLASESD